MNIFVLSLFVLLEALPIYYAALTYNQLYLINSKFNYENGITQCQKKSMYLIKITDIETNTLVYNFAVKNGIKNYYIDASDKKTKGEWLFNDGNKLEFLNFKEGKQDNENQNCINVVEPEGKWDVAACDQEMKIICYVGTSVISEEQMYLLPVTGGFDQAINLCKEKSMNLVKINDPGTNFFVHKHAQKLGLNLFWIDATDKITEGQWCSNDGNPLSFSNFRPGQPDNWGNNEHCANGNTEAPTWNDLPCDFDTAIMCYSEKQSG